VLSDQSAPDLDSPTWPAARQVPAARSIGQLPGSLSPCEMPSVSCSEGEKIQSLLLSTVNKVTLDSFYLEYYLNDLPSLSPATQVALASFSTDSPKHFENEPSMAENIRD